MPYSSPLPLGEGEKTKLGYLLFLFFHTLCFFGFLLQQLFLVNLEERVVNDR